MIDLALVFVGGVLGSAHCVGMCGPLALLVGGGAHRMSRNIQRQLIYSLGRIFTYAFCGAAAGFASQWLAQQSRWLLLAQGTLALVAGVLLALIGLTTTGALPRLPLRLLGQAPCHAATALKTILTAPGWTSVFLAGVGTGFIPCGLVYAFLLKAGASGSVAAGALTMTLFGLGTVPLMVLAGSGGSLLSIAARTRVYRMAAWCVVLAGAITIVRGANQLRAADGVAAPCPLCLQSAH